MSYLILLILFLITIELNITIKTRLEVFCLKKYFLRFYINFKNKKLFSNKGQKFYFIFLNLCFKKLTILFFKLLFSLVPIIIYVFLSGIELFSKTFLQINFQIILLIIILVYLKIIRKKIKIYISKFI